MTRLGKWSWGSSFLSSSKAAKAGGPIQVPHETHLPAMPSWEDFQRSPHYPLVVSHDPQAKGQTVNGSADPGVPIPINSSAMDIDTELFTGKLLVQIRGLPSTEPGFASLRRNCQVVIQGHWKEAVQADALWVGQQMLRPLGIPASMLYPVLHGAARVFASTSRVDASSANPSYINPLLAACQTVNVARPGEAPPMDAVPEDCRLLGPAWADKHGKALSSDKRRKLFDDPAVAAGVTITPDHVFTFAMYQNIVDFSNYQLSLGGWLGLDLLQYMGGQPLQLMLLNTQVNRRVFGLLVWHEKLIYPSGRPSQAALLQLAQHPGFASRAAHHLLPGSCADSDISSGSNVEDGSDVGAVSDNASMCSSMLSCQEQMQGLTVST